MSDTNWMEAEAYDLADKISEKLTMAYKQGVNDAWMNIKSLWNEKEVAWCLTCPHISEEDRELVRKAVEGSGQKTGKWIRHDEVRNVYGGTCVECSECGEKYVVRHIEDEKYCRNCGADMRGEKNE